MNKVMSKYRVEFFNVYEWGIQTIFVDAEDEDIAEQKAIEMELGQIVNVEEEENNE